MLRQMPRREFLRDGTVIGVSAMAGTLAACGTSQPAAPARTVTVTTQLEYLFDVTFAGWYLAAQRGYFAQQHIASRLLPYGTNQPTVASLVASGKADVGLSSIPEVIQENKKGAGLVVFGTQYQTSPAGLLSLAKNPVRTIRDVLGKRIGVDAMGRQLLNACLDAAGLPHHYTAVSVSRDPAPLAAGRVDAMTVFVTSQPIALTLQGVQNVAVPFADLGFPAYQNVLTARRDTVRSEPGVLARYLRAVILGWELNNARPADGAAAAYRSYGAQNSLSLQQQSLENRAQIPLMQSALTRQKGLFQLSLSTIAGPQYAALSRAGLRDLPSVQSYVTLDILNRVYNGATSTPG